MPSLTINRKNWSILFKISIAGMIIDYLNVGNVNADEVDITLSFLPYFVDAK